MRFELSDLVMSQKATRTRLRLCKTPTKSVKKVISIDYSDPLKSNLIDIIQCGLYPEAPNFYLFHGIVSNFTFKCVNVITVQTKIHKRVCIIRTMAPACPRVPVGSALAPPMVLTLLGWCIRTADPVTIAGGVPPGAVLTPCCRGCIRDC